MKMIDSDYGHMDATHLDVDDFFVDLDGKIDRPPHL